MKKFTSVASIILVAAMALTYVVTAAVYIVCAFTAPSIDTYMEASEKKGKFVSTDVYYCDGPIYYMTHTVNGIPVAKQYYYVVYDYQDRAILLCANKNFYKKFNDEGFAQNGVHIRGKAKKIDSDMREDMTDIKNEVAEYYDVTAFGGTDILYIDNSGVFESFLRIISMGMVAIPIVVMILTGTNVEVRNIQGPRKTIGVICILIMLGGLAMMMHSVSVWF